MSEGAGVAVSEGAGVAVSERVGGSGERGGGG